MKEWCKVSAQLYSAISCHSTKTFLQRSDKCDNVTWNRSQENVRQMQKRQFSKWTDLNLLAEGSSKVAVDVFEPAILRWQAGVHTQDPKPGQSNKPCVEWQGTQFYNQDSWWLHCSPSSETTHATFSRETADRTSSKDCPCLCEKLKYA